jgi:hypothetical protein
VITNILAQSKDDGLRSESFTENDFEMTNVNAFYKMLTKTLPGKGALTRSTRPQLTAISKDLAWQTWNAEGQPQHGEG